MADWEACARKMDECERLRARADSLEAGFRRRAERARDEGDIATMVRMRDAARVANMTKAALAELAGELSADLERAQAGPAGAPLDSLMARLEATAEKSRELAAVYEPFVDWAGEPS
jgi:hypothetical protein